MPDAQWQSIVDELTRRRFLGASLIASAAALTACGQASEEESATPETLDFVYEDVVAQIPANPSRVVVIEGRGDLEFALVAGYPVVASGFYFGREGALIDELAEDYEIDQIEELAFGDSYKPDYEQLATLAPDLIIMRVNAYVQDFYGNDAIARIAPVLAVQCGRPGWEEDLTAQASVLKRDEAAAAEVDRYIQVLEDARSALSEQIAELTIAVATALDDGSIYMWTNNLANVVIDDLGFTQPHYDPEDEEASYEVSAEQVDILGEADVLFIQSYLDRPALSESSLFQSLPAVQAGRVYDLDSNLNNGLGRSATGVIKRVREALTSDA